MKELIPQIKKMWEEHKDEVDKITEQIISPQSDDTKIMLKFLRKEFIPNKVLIFKSDEDTEIDELTGFTKNLKSLEGKATAYVCKNYQCNLPTTNALKMIKLLNSENKLE
jgi:uncharacterized protein YyaL (SSP411 family)